jgi:methionyl-tRNA formyltransferase
MSILRIALATPHVRHDLLANRLREHRGLDVLRIRERQELTAERLAAFGPSYVFFPHWSWKIPAEIHEAFECVIFHMTDVPFGRGGSPLQNLIVRGFKETRLSAIRCVAELDAGPVYMKKPLSLSGTAEQILGRAAALTEDMIVEIVERRPAPVPQQGEAVEFRRRTAADGNLALAANLEQAYDFIRMLDGAGYPPAFAEVARLRCEFTDATMNDGYLEARVRITERKND